MQRNVKKRHRKVGKAYRKRAAAKLAKVARKRLKQMKRMHVR